MAPLAGGNLSKVDIYASSVLKSPLEDVWQQARNFGQASWWSKAGQGEFNVKRLGGRAVAEIGCERMFTIGHARLFEELSALDDLEHIVRWILVSHPQTLSPFGQASFLNYTSSIQLRPVTMSNQTFAEWKGSFYTEPHYAAQMEAVLQSWYFAGFRGLEAAANSIIPPVVPTHPGLMHPNSLNPKYSIPVQPPGSDQLAFTSPMEARTGAPSSAPYDHSPDERVSLSHERGSNAGIATTSSQAWQAARAAFGSQQGQARPPHSKGMPSVVSPTSHTRPTSQDNESPVQAIHSNGRLMSDPSSAESYHQTRRTAESDPGHPSMGPADVRQSAGANYQHPQAAYLPHLGSINEQAQLPYAARDYYPDGALGGLESLNRQMEATGVHSNSSSLSSQHSQSSSHRGNLRNAARIRSLDEGQYQKVRQMQPAPRNSFQGQEASLRSGTASAMKNEAMQAFNMGAPPKDRSNRRKIQPDWSNMKEVAYVNSQQEAELMNSLAKNVDEHHTENTQRSSLEEEVAKLQERHNKLHGRVKSTSEQPFASPFSSSASPFEASKGEAPPNSFVTAQATAAANPFAAAQPTAPFSDHSNSG